MRKRWVLLPALLFSCLAFAQVSADSLDMLKKQQAEVKRLATLNGQQLQLANWENELPKKRRQAAEKQSDATNAAADNAKAAAALALDPQNRRLARKSKKAATHARKAARQSRKAAKDLEKLESNIDHLRKKVQASARLGGNGPGFVESLTHISEQTYGQYS